MENNAPSALLDQFLVVLHCCWFLLSKPATWPRLLLLRFWKHQGLVHEKTIFSQGTPAGCLSSRPLHRANTKLRSLEWGGGSTWRQVRKTQACCCILRRGVEWVRPAPRALLSQLFIFKKERHLKLSSRWGLVAGSCIMRRSGGWIRDEFCPPTHPFWWGQQCPAPQSPRPLTAKTCSATGPCATLPAIICITIQLRAPRQSHIHRRESTFSLGAESCCARLHAKNEKWPVMRRYQHRSLAENHNAAAVDANSTPRRTPPVGFIRNFFCFMPVGGSCFT